jgi:hypothetical protein
MMLYNRQYSSYIVLLKVNKLSRMENNLLNFISLNSI